MKRIVGKFKLDIVLKYYRHSRGISFSVVLSSSLLCRSAGLHFCHGPLISFSFMDTSLSLVTFSCICSTKDKTCLIATCELCSLQTLTASAGLIHVKIML